MAKSHARIYHSHRHALATLVIIIAPFVFLLSFSELADLGRTRLIFDILVSFGRLIIAYLIAAVLGWLAAVAFYRGRRATLALPIFDVLQSLPSFALLPVAVLFLGPSNLTITIFLVAAVIWPIFFSLISALKLVKRDWEDVARISGLRGWRYLRDFLWPVSIPALVTGSIIGLGEGWEAIVATEIIVHASSGVGNFFARFAANPAVTTFGLLGFLIFIFSVNKLIWLPLLSWSHSRMQE